MLGMSCWPHRRSSFPFKQMMLTLSDLAECDTHPLADDLREYRACGSAGEQQVWDLWRRRDRSWSVSWVAW